MKSAPLHFLGPILIAVSLVALNSPVWAQAEDAPGKPAARPIAESIVGHWGIDRDQMLKALTERAAEGAGGEGFDAAARDLLVEMVRNLEAKMILEFTAEGISRLHSPDHEDDAAYKIVKADENTGEFTLEVKSPENEPDTVAGKVKGDRLSLESDDLELHFRRLSEEETKSRLAAVKGEVEEKEQAGKSKEVEGPE